MKISDVLSPNHVMIDVAAADKQKLLLTLARKVGSIVDVLPELVFAELQKREELGSTGLGGGVALPHARFHQVGKPTGIPVRLRRPMEFDAVDGKPVDLVFVLLLPKSSNAEQLDALAFVARKLRNPKITAALREASDSAEMYHTLAAE